MPDPIVLDNTILLDAAEALEREAEVLHRYVIDDAEAPSCLREGAAQLRAVALAANHGELRVGRFGWPGINVVVQGVAEERRGCCNALRGPEPYQPVCTLEVGHDGPHWWGRAHEEPTP